MKRILILQGPNLNLLGWISRKTGTRLTLDKLNRALRDKARELDVEIKICQTQSEVEASKIVQRERNKSSGVLLIAGIWASTGYLLHETLAITKLPLAVFQLVVNPGPWSSDSVSMFSDLVQMEGAGSDPEELAGFLGRFAERLSD